MILKNHFNCYNDLLNCYNKLMKLLEQFKLLERIMKTIFVCRGSRYSIFKDDIYCPSVIMTPKLMIS